MISNLSTLRKGAHWVVYKMEEKKALEVVDSFSAVHYKHRIFLDPRRATRENFFLALEDMEARPEVKVIDVIIYLHGLPGRLCFKGEIGTEGGSPCSPMREVADRIQSLGTASGGIKKLRMLYSDACYGESHLDHWLSAGFRAVNGAILQDTNKTWDLRSFLKQWVRGRNYETAMERANRLAITPVMDRIVGGNSFKETRGELGLTIRDP